MQGVNVILAECPGLGRVRLCECNSIHLNIGPVTLNLEPAAFAQIATLMSSAMEQLSGIVGTNDTADPSLQSLKIQPNRFTN